MPVFLDRHQIDGVTAEAVAAAHKLDLQCEGKHGTHFMTYWVDEKRESITPLCMALGIRPTPDHVVAFFPEELEKKLLKLELQYRGRREDDIYETRFKVRKTASGYEPIVIEQKAK